VKLPAFDYIAAASPLEAVTLLAAHTGDAKIIAGGQSLLPTMAFRLSRPSLLVDLRRLHELRHSTIAEHEIVLGARTRWCDIEADARLASAAPLLVEAVRHVAHYQVRNRGTVGGSLAHADPAAEMPCIAVTCDAELALLSPRGERRVRAADFFEGPLATVLREDELIVAVHLPRWAVGRKWGFREFSLRPGDFALAGIALHHGLGADGRIEEAHVGAIGACYCPRRIGPAEAALNGCVPSEATLRAAARAAAAAVDDVQDLHADAQYRRALVGVLTERALRDAWARR